MKLARSRSLWHFGPAKSTEPLFSRSESFSKPNSRQPDIMYSCYQSHVVSSQHVVVYINKDFRTQNSTSPRTKPYKTLPTARWLGGAIGLSPPMCRLRLDVMQDALQFLHGPVSLLFQAMRTPRICYSPCRGRTRFSETSPYNTRLSLKR